MDPTGFHQAVRILKDMWEFCKSGGQVGNGEHFLVHVCFFFPGEFAEQYIPVYGPQQAVRIKVALVPEGHGLHHQQFILLFPEPGKGEPPQVGHGNPYKFVFPEAVQLAEYRFFKGVDHIGMVENGCPGREFPVLVEVCRQEVV